MFFAKDKYNKRVYIGEAINNENYFCPICEEKLILKNLGTIKAHHFAHPSKSVCLDSWHYDMSEWHIAWQNGFPREYQEIIRSFGNQKHRADVLIESKKAVFEFQHSPLSLEEFEKRNRFYSSLGYKVIWIFDAEEQYKNGQVENYKTNLWYWKHPKHTFDLFNPKNENIEIYLQLDNENIELIKVIWCGDEGMSRFATDGFSYGADDITDRFAEKNRKRDETVNLSSLYDKLIFLYWKDHSRYNFGCPITKEHLCVNTNIDLSPLVYDSIMPCNECEYGFCEGLNLYCRKRFRNLELDGNTQVLVEKCDSNGFICQISYMVDGLKEIVNIETYRKEIAKNVFELWKDNKYTTAVFRNIKTGKFIKIIKNPQEQCAKYGRVFGYLSIDGSDWSSGSCELYGLWSPNWVCIWFK